MKAPEPVSQHQWLQRMVGEWVWESEYEPGKKMTGTESVRPLGSLWVICHGRGEMPEGGGHQSIMTLGNDPRKERFVGTFVGSVMNNLWIYSGVLEGNGLTLDTGAELHAGGEHHPVQGPHRAPHRRRANAHLALAHRERRVAGDHEGRTAGCDRKRAFPREGVQVTRIACAFCLG